MAARSRVRGAAASAPAAHERLARGREVLVIAGEVLADDL